MFKVADIQRVKDDIKKTFGSSALSVVEPARLFENDGKLSINFVPNIAFVIIGDNNKVPLYYNYESGNYFVFGSIRPYTNVGEAFLQALECNHDAYQIADLCLKFGMFLVKNPASVAQIREDVLKANPGIETVWTLKFYTVNSDGDKADPGHVWIKVVLPAGLPPMWVLAGEGKLYTKTWARKYNALPTLIAEHSISEATTAFKSLADNVQTALMNLVKEDS